MAAEPDFVAHSGTARFPRDREDLRITTACPGCFTPLTTVPCAQCGLDVGHPLAAELALVSADAARLLDERVRIIGRIRAETARAAELSAAVAAEAAALPRAMEHVHAPAPVPAPDPASTAPPPREKTEEPAGPRRSSVQVLLLIVGVSLVSVAAIFFLVYAFLTYGLIWRTAIIGAITVAAFVAASLLRRRSLGSTAEGIGAFAVVLVYLDVVAIRANDLFGAAAADGLAYWGTALVISSAGFFLWHRLSGLRVARIAAFLVLAPGAALLVAGLTPGLGALDRAYLAFLAAGVSGLVHPLAGGVDRITIERVTALTIAGAGLAVAFPLAFAVGPGATWAAPVALLGVAGAAAAHVGVAAVAARRLRVVRGVRLGFAALGALGLASAAVLAGYRLPTLEGGIVASACAVTLVALALARAALRPHDRTTAARTVDAPPRAPALGAARVAALVASGVAVLAVAVPTVIAVIAAADIATTSMLATPWRSSPSDRIAEATPTLAAAVLALALCLALVGGFAAIAWRTTGLWALLAWALPALAVLAVPLLGVYGAVTAAWLLLAAVGVTALVATRRSGAITAAGRRPWAALAVTAGVLGYATSWASTATWLAGSIAVVALLVVARRAFPAASTTARAALLGTALVAGLVAATAVAQLPGWGATSADRMLDSVRYPGILAVAVVVLSALPLARILSAVDRRVAVGLAGTVTAIALPGFALVDAFFAGTATPTLLEPWTSVALGVVLLGGLCGWLLARGNAAHPAARATSAIALPVVVAWVLDGLLVAAGVPPEVRSLAPVAAVLLAAAGFLLLERARPAGVPRRSADSGIAVVGAWGVLVAVIGSSELGWLTLLLTAVTVLLLGWSADGLIGSASRRRHLGWLALALANLALWWRLADASVDAVEAYTLPLAGALLLVALLVRRVEARHATGVPSKTAPAITLLALVTAVLPSAFVETELDTTEAQARALVVGAVAAALLLVGSLVRPTAALRPYLDVAASAGLGGLVVVVVGRGLVFGTASRGTPDGLLLDAWLAVALGVLALAAVGQASGRRGDSPLTARAAQTLLVTGLAMVLLFESVAFDSSAIGGIRAVVVVVLLCAVYVVGSIVDRAPVTRTVAGMALAGAVLAGVAGAVAGAITDVEQFSVPIAVSLLVVGARTLARRPEARSWPAIGAGVAVLLLPPLLATVTERPVWRLVAIGVVAIAVLVIGLLRRLQAPLVLGAVVAVVHGAATLAPQVRVVYQLTEWWVWAGLGGIVIIVLAARYERGIRTARGVVEGIRALR
jgi:hypothetical protein